MVQRLELTPGQSLSAFLPVEALRYGRFAAAQAEYTFAPEGDSLGLDELTVSFSVSAGAMVLLGVSIDTEADALRLTLEPVADISSLRDVLLDKETLRSLPQDLARLRAILLKEEELTFHFRNETLYQVPLVIDASYALISEEQAVELREKRGP
jgi:hypothetical protein